MPTNRIPRELFDYHAKGRREKEVARQRVEKKNSSKAKIGVGQKASALQMIIMIYWNRLWKTIKDPRHNNLSPNRDLNPVPPESEAELLNTEPWVGPTVISELEYVSGHILKCTFCRRKPACSWVLVVRTMARSQTGSTCIVRAIRFKTTTHHIVLPFLEVNYRHFLKIVNAKLYRLINLVLGCLMTLVAQLQ